PRFAHSPRSVISRPPSTTSAEYDLSSRNVASATENSSPGAPVARQVPTRFEAPPPHPPSTMPASRAPVIATTFVVRFIFGLLSPRVIGYTPARWPARNPLRPRTRRPRVPCAVPSIEQLQKLLQAEPDDTFLLY